MLLWDRRCSHGLALKEELGLQRILKEGSRYVGSPDKVIINWGCSNPPRHCYDSQWINTPGAVTISVDKIRTFQYMTEHGVRTVPWTPSQSIAQNWLNEGSKVVVRSTTTGREGAGIQIIDAMGVNLPVQRDDATLLGWVRGLLNASVRPSWAVLPHAPLYTKFIPHTREYRVHVVDGRAINVRRKTLDDFYNVRVYPDDIVTQAVAATRAVGLDFAGVDVLWDNTHAWVLETNTAPGIGGLTVGHYASALRNLIWRRHGITF